MLRDKNPFTIQVKGGEINDRALPGFSDRLYEGTGIPSKELGSLRRVIELRVTAVFLWVVIVVYSLLYFRVLWLQVIKGEEYRFIAEGNRIRLETLPAQRGIITDRNGKELVENVPQYIVTMTPADWPKTESARLQQWEQLKSFLPTLTNQSLLNDIDWRSYQPLVLEENISHDLALQLISRQAKWPGVNITISTRRNYLLGTYAGHILGYMSPLTLAEYKQTTKDYLLTDYIGRLGIEAWYEDELRGKPGKREIEVDNLGKSRKVFAQIDPQEGKRLILTIDSDLQIKVAQSLVRQIKNYGKSKGAALVLNPKTGEILSLVSAPLFDPQVFSPGHSKESVKLLTDQNKPLFNRAISGEYPSGSTIKPVLAAAALNEGIITTKTTVVSTGGIWAGNRFFADWKAGGHGVTDLFKAIAESVNTFFYIIGGGYEDKSGLGVTKIAKYLKSFNFGSKTGVDLAGEASGLVPDEAWKEKIIGERWYLGDTYNLSIGQGNFLTTPLQLGVAYSALVNGGLLFKPHLVKALVEGEQTNLIEPEIIKTVPISEENLSIVVKAMRQTITSGSARLLGDLPIQVGGKTGTAQTSAGKPPHSWFVGFAPYNDPSIVVVVLIEDGGDSSTVAVPIAREIFSWYAQNRL